MAKKPTDKMLVCTKDGVHGKQWRVGDKAAARELKQLGGFIPGYFKPEGTAKVDDPDQLDEVRNWLAAKQIPYSDKMSLSKLNTMRDRAIAEGIYATPDPGVEPSPKGRNTPVDPLKK